MPSKCPLCESPCIIKVISDGDKKYGEVDVCELCGATYPRNLQTSVKAGVRAPASQSMKKKK